MAKEEIEIERQFNEMMCELEAKFGIKQEKSNTDLNFKFISNLNYEIWVSYEYKNNNPSTVITPLDDYDLSVKMQYAYNEALGDERVDANGNFTSQFKDELTAEDENKFQKLIDELYFKSDLRSLSNPQNEKMIPYIRERDSRMESQLRDVMAKNSGTTVFVCGNFHFYGDYGNLYERVKDLSPVRVILPEVDKF